MHGVVLESLEELLAGTLNPAAQRDIEAHIGACKSCREELEGMRDVSQLFAALRSEEAWEPSPGFFAGVKERVAKRQAAPAFWNLFALDFAFGRRLVFASLLMLAVTGSYLVSREAGHSDAISPETVMAQQNSPAFDSARAQDNMLVTLASYEPGH